MNCPFCGKEMEKGTIPADRVHVKWVSDEGGEDGFPEKIRLSQSPDIFTDKAEAFLCRDCRQVIVPVPEIETLSEKWKAKFDALTDKIDRFQEERESRQEEKQKEKKWNKRRGKDPWEW